jgi:signal transduction histidine kinase
MTAVETTGARFLQTEDFVRFNEWLWITRLRSIAGIVVVVALLSWLSPTPALDATPVLAVCASYLAASLGYRRWLRTGRRLRALAYVQLVVDTLAITVGLLFVHESPFLFHFLFLLTVVPASMLEPQCGVAIAALSTAGHLFLLWMSDDQSWGAVATVLPPATFFLAASQSVFYARQLGRKNADLAATAASLDESNQRLAEEAVISGALLRSAQALTTSLDPREIRERLTESVRTALGCNLSITFLRDERQHAYRVAAVSGTDADVVEEIRACEITAASAWVFEMVAQRGVAALDDRTASLFPPFLLERWDLSAFLCADLRNAGASVGMLAAGFRQRATGFAPRELRLVSSIAQQAALALENARLVEGLRGANRLKSEFIGTMSHELRSPLNVVMGYVDLLLDGEMGPLEPEQRTALARVQRHSLQLLELIEETLDINRLEAGRLPMDLETFPVNDFVDDVRESIPSDWSKPNVELRWELAPAPVFLRSDRAKLKKVLRNLVHNALKFTERGSVTVSVSSSDTGVSFRVSDTGVGISPEALPVIFEMFRQVDGSPTRRHGGVGLGLYIVKQLVRGLGGDVSVTSQPGAGSAFHVRLPLGLDAPAPAGAPAGARFPSA